MVKMFLNLSNMNKIIIIFLISLFPVLLASSCTRVDDQPETTTPYELKIPAKFPAMKIPGDNPMTVEGVQLGRMLYYDPMLHKDGNQSCATCHNQNHGFTTPGFKPFTEFGVVLPHINLGWNDKYLWEGQKEGTLEDIMLFEVQDFFEADLSKFNNSSQYKALFKKAYNTDYITHKHLAYALSQFFRTMISGNSKFDKHMRGETPLTLAEQSGMTLFFTEKGDCFHCHGSILFTDNDFHNNGLNSNPDNGRFNITKNPADIGKYKTPTLRNVEVRPGYMNDGRFKTLEEVVEHYNSGVKMSPTLDPVMTKNNKQLGLFLTAKEKSDLVAFLKTLTDSTFLTNPDLKSPF
jgi:cytochrome c peroxidase